jgi:hypothetical protein
MKNTPKMLRALVAPATTALVLATTTASAHAVIVNIDTSQSTVTYSSSFPTICVPSGTCYPPPATQTFSLSGSFDVKRETVPVMTIFFDIFYQEQIHFESLAVDAGGAAALGFMFPTYPGIVTAASFSASEDSCSLSMGTCFSNGNFGAFSGDFNDGTISFSGTSYGSSAYDHFAFNVVANAAGVTAVPEPEGLSLLGVGVLALLARRRKEIQ